MYSTLSLFLWLYEHSISWAQRSLALHIGTQLTYVLAGFLAQGWGLILSTKWSVLLFALSLTQNNGQIACH